MKSFVDATLIGYFPEEVQVALSKPLGGSRLRQQMVSEGYVADLFTGSFKGANPDDIVVEIEQRIGDWNAALLIDDDNLGFRTILYRGGVIVSDSGYGDE